MPVAVLDSSVGTEAWDTGVPVEVTAAEGIQEIGTQPQPERDLRSRMEVFQGWLVAILAEDATGKSFGAQIRGMQRALKVLVQDAETILPDDRAQVSAALSMIEGTAIPSSLQSLDAFCPWDGLRDGLEAAHAELVTLLTDRPKNPQAGNSLQQQMRQYVL